MFQLSRAVKRPIAMFVVRSDQAAIEAAVDAGVSAYVVDGLKRERVKPILDPISGQPASKAAPARIERFVAATYGFAVLRRKPQAPAAEYWALARCRGGWRVEMAFAAGVAY